MGRLVAPQVGRHRGTTTHWLSVLHVGSADVKVEDAEIFDRWLVLYTRQPDVRRGLMSGGRGCLEAEGAWGHS